MKIKLNIQLIKKWIPLALISSMGLFLELAVIRWLSAEVHLFSYLKNIPLLAAFLGLSVGFAMVGKRKNLKSTFAPILFLFSIMVITIGRISSPGPLIYPETGDEFIWSTALIPYWMALLSFLGTVLIFFLITMLMFISLGEATGQELNRHQPVPAYVVNIGSSLIGIWLFSFVSFLQTEPIIWFGIAVLGVSAYFFSRRILLRAQIVLFIATLAVMGLFSQDAIWSPYQRLSISDLNIVGKDDKPIKVGYTVDVQHVFYQRAVNLSPQFLTGLNGNIPLMEDLAYSYNLPYLISPEGSEVLIVGAGLGNDVAAALRNNMGSVVAVEIDPTILNLGEQFHPEEPYKDDRVTMVVDDARSFFEKNIENFDIIAFGLLDSHTLLSEWSSVRLDSYVYTIESFKAVREHLKEDGIASITFASTTPWIEERLGRMLRKVFGPDRVWVYHGSMETIFLAGQVKSDQLGNISIAQWESDPEFNNLPIPTDDWPYLYLRNRLIPRAYWQALLAIGIITLLFLARSFPAALRPDWHFWFLGAAFLLIEFSSITRLALLFGTTWLVNALAISGVLIMILGANLVVLRTKKLNQKLNYFLLFVSLALVYLYPLETLNQLSPIIKALTSMILLSLPLFFSGLIFSEALRQFGQAAGPLASTLSGSVFGGVLEYGSLLWGIQSLYIIAVVCYGLAFIAFIRRRV